MAEAMVRDSSRDFWHEEANPATCVDGELGDDRIVELWAPKFRDLFTSIDHTPMNTWLRSFLR